MDDKFEAELHEFLHQLVGIAAAAAVPYFRSGVAAENKAVEGFDPVTAADRETEDVVRAAIAERFPDHGVIGEERDPHRPNAKYQWIIDPIDGTKAFVCGLPTWATLVGLCDEDVPVLGMMSQPVVGEYFIGGHGRSERFDKHGRFDLRTSAVETLAQASLFATAPDMFSLKQELPRFNALSKRVRLTRFGVDSYAYCMLAAGFIDIVAEAGLGFYDIAALVPIIEAAGGVVSDWSGRPVRSGGTVLAAANPELYAAALATLDG